MGGEGRQVERLAGGLRQVVNRRGSSPGPAQRRSAPVGKPQTSSAGPVAGHHGISSSGISSSGSDSSSSTARWSPPQESAP